MPRIHSSYRVVSAALIWRQSTHSLLSIFFAVGLLVAIGGFVLQIAGTSTTEPFQATASSILAQAILGSIYLVASILLIRSPSASAILVRVWPILVLPFLAFLSAAWSPDPFLTLRRSFAFLGTILFGLSLASRFTFKDGLNLITQTLSVSMVLSVVWTIALPAQGIHQATDLPPVFVGLWRGIFAHRNILGYNAGFTIALLIVYGRAAFHSWLLRGGALIASIACLIGARSGGGFSITFTMLALLSSMSFFGRLAPKLRLIILTLYSLAAACSTIFLDEIIAAALSILGKDPDLTGRVPYWHYLMALINKDEPMLGYGYYAGFALKIRPEIYESTGMDFMTPHNGYLDVLIAFGYIGLAVCILVFVWLEWRAIRLIILSAKHPYILDALPFVIITSVICYNFIEPSFISPNSQVVVLLAWLTPRLVGLDKCRRQAT